MAREKRKSDEVYNARRRAKRALDRELKKKVQDKEKIANLKANIQQSYATKQNEYLIDTESFIEKSKESKKESKADINRKNLITQREINQASSGGISKYSKEETKIFYAATKRAWEGKPQGTWNEAIMKYYGVETLEEAWNLIFENEDVKRALQKAKDNQKQLQSEQDFADGSGDEKEAKGSPTYIKELIGLMDMR